MILTILHRTEDEENRECFYPIEHDVLQDLNSAEKWLKENVRHMHKKTDHNHYIFVSKSDAMAFKLAWYE